VTAASMQTSQALIQVQGAAGDLTSQSASLQRKVGAFLDSLKAH